MIRKLGNQIYLVKSDSSDTNYRIDLYRKECNCPYFKYRCKGRGLICKHIQRVMNLFSYQDKVIIDYIKERGEVDVIELIEKFDEGRVDELIKKCELLERGGKIVILE